MTEKSDCRTAGKENSTRRKHEAPQRHLGDMQNILLIEGQVALADRVTRALCGFPFQVEVSKDLFNDQGRRGTKPTLALVSFSVFDNVSLSLHEWEAVLGIPILWVVDGQERTAQLAECKSYISAEFTSAELQGAVEAMLPGYRQKSAHGLGIVAISANMRRLLDDVAVYAGYDVGTLLLGDTGTGKERIARALHDGHIHRAQGPFVGVNCGAIPDGLFESLFMGHAKGAFTGAVQAHAGYFEQACGGTLFLDEVGDLPLHQQIKLLRVLEERRVLRVGSTSSIAVDFRLVAATNRDLEQLVREGRFRADLFYRLAVVVLRLPSVDERGAADKLALFERFYRQAATRYGSKLLEIPDWVQERVQAGRYPGNARQLANLAERIAILVAHRRVWDSDAVGAQLLEVSAEVLTKEQLVERGYILDALEDNGWRRRETAESLGISRKALWEKMRRYGVREQNTGDDPVVPLSPRSRTQ